MVNISFRGKSKQKSSLSQIPIGPVKGEDRGKDFSKNETVPHNADQATGQTNQTCRAGLKILLLQTLCRGFFLLCAKPGEWTQFGVLGRPKTSSRSGGRSFLLGEGKENTGGFAFHWRKTDGPQRMKMGAGKNPPTAVGR